MNKWIDIKRWGKECLKKNKCIVKIKWLNEVFKKMNGFGKVKKMIQWDVWKK
jgi:hypothetical protein